MHYQQVTVEEWDSLMESQREIVLFSGSYELAKKIPDSIVVTNCDDDCLGECEVLN